MHLQEVEDLVDSLQLDTHYILDVGVNVGFVLIAQLSSGFKSPFELGLVEMEHSLEGGLEFVNFFKHYGSTVGHDLHDQKCIQEAINSISLALFFFLYGFIGAGPRLIIIIIRGVSNSNPQSAIFQASSEFVEENNDVIKISNLSREIFLQKFEGIRAEEYLRHDKISLLDELGDLFIDKTLAAFFKCLRLLLFC